MLRVCFPTFTLHLSHCPFHNVHHNCLQKVPGKQACAKKSLWCNLSIYESWSGDIKVLTNELESSIVVLSFVESSKCPL